MQIINSFVGRLIIYVIFMKVLVNFDYGIKIMVIRLKIFLENLVELEYINLWRKV